MSGFDSRVEVEKWRRDGNGWPCAAFAEAAAAEGGGELEKRALQMDFSPELHPSYERCSEHLECAS